MKKILGIAVLLTCASGLVVAQNKNSDVPVTTIVSDYDSGIGPSLEIQSDQLGAYTYSSGSSISSAGVWYLALNDTRTVVLRFTNPIAGSGPNGGDPVAPPSGNYR